LRDKIVVIKPYRLSSWIEKIGLGGTLVTALSALGCCAPAWAGPVLSLSATLSLGFLVDHRVALPVLYLALAIILAGLLLSWREHRRPYFLIAGLFGAVLVLYPFHTALDVDLFFGLLYTGMSLLLLASLGEAILRWRLRQGKLKEAG